MENVTGLAALTQEQLAAWVTQAKAQTRMGRLPDYIPLLAKVNVDWVSVQVQQGNGCTNAAGDTQQPFVLMSVIKPFVLLFLLELLGRETVFARVGMDPSDQPFHSLLQLQADRGFPRNPMINSGAIALADLIPGKDGTTRCETLRQWLNHLSGSQLVLDRPMLASVRALPNEANRLLANGLHQSGYLYSIETALDTYNQICCLSGTVADLAKLGLLLAGGDTPSDPAIAGGLSHAPFPIFAPPRRAHRRIVNALMLTCGLYEVSGRFAVGVGLPTKSGVSGALLAVVPGEGAIACYSPAIDQAGNSVAGLFLLEQLTQTLNLSLFG